MGTFEKRIGMGETQFLLFIGRPKLPWPPPRMTSVQKCLVSKVSKGNDPKPSRY